MKEVTRDEYRAAFEHLDARVSCDADNTYWHDRHGKLLAYETSGYSHSHPEPPTKYFIAEE